MFARASASLENWLTHKVGGMFSDPGGTCMQIKNYGICVYIYEYIHISIYIYTYIRISEEFAGVTEGVPKG